MKIKLKRINGTTVLIVCNFCILGFTPEITIRRVQYRQKGKRKWQDVFDNNSWEYRELSMEDRKEFEKKAWLEYVTEEELHQAQIALWQTIKPGKV